MGWPRKLMVLHEPISTNRVCQDNTFTESGARHATDDPRTVRRTAICFVNMNKLRREYPSEAWMRVVHGDKLLQEKFGRNEKCCLSQGCF